MSSHTLSLWKRALLHGLKTLVRRHPGAALHAAGATVAYAGREVAHDGADFVKEKIEDASHALPVHRSAHQPKQTLAGKLSKEEAKALLEKLSAEERRALADLAPRRSD
jgi:hypothetical protein